METVRRNPGNTSHSFPRKKTSIVLSAFRRSLGCGFVRSFPCLWRMALATFTLCGGLSNRLRPCCLALTPGFTSLTLLRSKRSRARCHNSWLWFLGRARSHARRGIEIASLNAAATTTDRNLKRTPAEMVCTIPFALTCFPQLVQRVQCHSN